MQRLLSRPHGRPENGRAFAVLLVSEDRKLLRHLSRFLHMLGYAVTETADKDRARWLLDVDPPGLWIVDADPDPDGALQLCRAAGSRDRPIHTLLLVGNDRHVRLEQALEADVADFLAKPVVYGELLMRLRAGARVLEFERRIADQTLTDLVSGLPGRPAFYERLRVELGRAEGLQRATACVLADLDFLGRLNNLHGRAAGDEAIRAAAGRLGDLCRPEDMLAASGGCFFVLLPGTSEGDAFAWAEQARGALAKIKTTAGEVSSRLAASFGVASAGAGHAGAEQLIENALEALRAAKSSGRNCVVRFVELEEDAAAWGRLAPPGKLFEHTLARDVMTPCPLVLRADQTQALAAALFRQTRLELLAVVDEKGRLVGLLTPQDVSEESGGQRRPDQPISDVMLPDPLTFEEQATFAALVEFFARDSATAAVIVCDGRPTGFVTPSSLAALSQPVTQETFAPGAPSLSSDYLMVPEVLPLDA